jgi:hypothetical protein
MAQIASSTAAVFPVAVRDLLRSSLQLRDRYEQGEVSTHGLQVAAGRLEAKLDRMLDSVDRDPANQRLARHLDHERPWIFTFLYCTGLEATNYAAERAIRGIVIARKVWGGNRTWEGAHTNQVLVSVVRTAGNKERMPFHVWCRYCAPQTVAQVIVPGADSCALHPPATPAPCLTR